MTEIKEKMASLTDLESPARRRQSCGMRQEVGEDGCCEIDVNERCRYQSGRVPRSNRRGKARASMKTKGSRIIEYRGVFSIEEDSTAQENNCRDLTEKIKNKNIRH